MLELKSKTSLDFLGAGGMGIGIGTVRAYAGGIRASQGTFSSFSCSNCLKYLFLLLLESGAF